MNTDTTPLRQNKASKNCDLVYVLLESQMRRQKEEGQKNN